MLYIGCTCNAEGSETAACDTAGKCTCKPNVVGADCDKCAEGYFGFPDCQGKFSHTSFLDDQYVRFLFKFSGLKNLVKWREIEFWKKGCHKS